ncbi:Ig-like domain-containing protein [Promicromonospora soli]
MAITSPEGGAELEHGQVEVAASATDAENAVSQVEFFVDGESIGVDDAAPYTASWDVAADGYYELTAVATNDRGLATTSRIVVAQVGDVFGGMRTFTNADGEFEQLSTGRYVIDSGGANMWQGTDEYSTIFREGSDRHWSATVRINSQGNSHGSAKAGIIVRNDVTQPGSSPGYAALGIRPSGGFEWLRGNAAGQLVTSTGGGSTAYPAWVRLVRDGDLYTAYRSSDGETFTQIGEPEALAGAADVQDVGLFVTAHSTSARSAVEFQDFVFTDEPDPPVIEVSAGSRCTGPQARVTVSATNAGADPARVRISTAYGSKTFGEVLPGETVSRQFASGTGEADAGTVTVTATNGPHEVEVEDGYDAASCG